MVEIDVVLKTLVERNGSDLHLKVGRPPMFRVSGDLIPSEFPVVTRENMEQILRQLCGDKGFKKLEEHLEYDTAYALPGVARFRVNALHQMQEKGAILRAIPFKIPAIDDMNLPPVLKDIVAQPQGLVLVTGPTGSGKSTTLASMVNHLNETQPLHIITIEDPVEFVYSDKMSTMNQRQLGQDTGSLHHALKSALRQDPDVILMGEMRDRETIEIAIHAAETGHLVFSTLHTNDAKQSVDRVLDSFPGDMIGQIRQMLSLSLRAVLSQRLLKRADGAGRVAALEILINSPNVRELIAAGKTADIEKAMKTAGAYYRMQTFNQALAKLVHDNMVTEEEAMGTSSNPGDLRLLIKGIMQGGATSSTEIKPKAPEASPAAGAAPPAASSAPAALGSAPAAPAADPNKPKIMKGFKL